MTCPSLASQAGLAVQLGWHDAWLHERRGPGGEWESEGGGLAEQLRRQPLDYLNLRDGKGGWLTGHKYNDAYEKAATGMAARRIRVHDRIVYGVTEIADDGFGYQTRLVPAEITKVRHHWEGRGKHRVRYTDIDETLPDGTTDHESMKDGSHVKVLPREIVAETLRDEHLGVHQHVPRPPPPPKRQPKPLPGSEFPSMTGPAALHKPAVTTAATPPRFKPGPEVKGLGDISTVMPGGYDKPQVMKAMAEVQAGLDRQTRWVPGAVKRQKLEIRPDFGDKNTEGETGYDETIKIKPDTTDAFSGAAATKAEMEHERRANFWSPGDPDVSLADSTVAHEMGHRLADDIPTKDQPEMWAGVANALHIAPPPTFYDPITKRQEPNTGAWLFLNGVGDAITSGVSRYATTDPQELEAELWREYTTSSHPRPPAQFYGDFVMAHLPAKDTAP